MNEPDKIKEILTLGMKTVEAMQYDRTNLTRREAMREAKTNAIKDIKRLMSQISTDFMKSIEKTVEEIRDKPLDMNDVEDFHKAVVHVIYLGMREDMEALRETFPDAQSDGDRWYEIAWDAGYEIQAVVSKTAYACLYPTSDIEAFLDSLKELKKEMRVL